MTISLRARRLVGLLFAGAGPAACADAGPAAPEVASVGEALEADPHWACAPADCDIERNPTGTGAMLIDGANVAPGSRICLKPGRYGSLFIKNLRGTPEAPIEVTNCGGQAIIGDATGQTSNGLDVVNSKHFRVVGTGSTDPAAAYGIKVEGTGGSGITMYNGASDLELAWVEVDRATFAGVMAKSNPGCDRLYTRENFTQYNTHLHHNYIHDTVEGEGFYIGYHTCAPKSAVCDGVAVDLYPSELRGVRIHDNRIERAAADGLQLGCAVEDVEVYENVIDGYGLEPFKPVHKNGIQIGIGTTGRWHDNVIANGTGNALQVAGTNVVFYNNLLINTGGVYYLPSIPAGTEVAVVNNTLVGTVSRGFAKATVNSTVSLRIHNNILVHDPAIVPIQDDDGFTVSHNFITTDVAAVGFVDPAAGDYHLRPDSPARDAGLDLSAYLAADFDGDPRNDGAFDIGADEVATAGGGPAFALAFAGAASVGAYVSAASPSSGQLNDISAEANGGVFSIQGGRLQLARAGASGTNTGAGLARWTDLAAAPGALSFRFDVGVSGWTNSTFQNNAFCLDVGKFTGSFDYTSAGAASNLFSSLCIDGKGNGAFAFETGGASSPSFAADGTMYNVVYFLNRSGATASYRGPDGSARSLAPNRVAVWVGTSLVIDGVAAPNGGSSSLSDFRMRWSTPDNGTWQLDNLVVETTLPQ